MLPSPTFLDVLEHRSLNQRALCAILFAPTFSEVAAKHVLPRLEYLDCRSSEYIHFYCAGYGAYEGDAMPRDAKKFRDLSVIERSGNNWWFSSSAFGSFIDSIHEATNWRYSGETELIVMNPSVDFTDSIVLNIQRMVSDRAIDLPAELFEDILLYARELHSSTSGFSDSKMPKVLGQTIAAALQSGIGGVVRGYKAGRHFATRSIHNGRSP